jgi:hypothetical protein
MHYTKLAKACIYILLGFDVGCFNFFINTRRVNKTKYYLCVLHGLRTILPLSHKKCNSNF